MDSGELLRVLYEDGKLTAAVEIDDHGFGPIGGVLGPYIQGQAILASSFVDGASEGSEDSTKLVRCFWIRL